MSLLDFKRISVYCKLLLILMLITPTTSHAFDCEVYKGVNISSCNSINVFTDKTGINFYGVKIEPKLDGSGYIVKQGNKKEEVEAMYSSVENLRENAIFYENFPDKDSVTMVFGYGTGGSCCNEYIIITKSQEKVFGSIINSGRPLMRIANINNAIYMIVPSSDIQSFSDRGAGFKPYPYRVMIFENGQWRYGKIGENKDVYKWLISQTNNEIKTNSEKSWKEEFDIDQKITDPSIEISFYQTMLQIDRNTILKELKGALPKNRKNVVSSVFAEVEKAAKNTILPADDKEIFKKRSKRYINY